MNSDKYKGFSVMLGESFRESISDFHANGEHLSEGNKSYQEGYLMGLYRVFTLIEQSADVNDISISELGLDHLTIDSFSRLN